MPLAVGTTPHMAVMALDIQIVGVFFATIFFEGQETWWELRLEVAAKVEVVELESQFADMISSPKEFYDAPREVARVADVI